MRGARLMGLTGNGVPENAAKTDAGRVFDDGWQRLGTHSMSRERDSRLLFLLFVTLSYVRVTVCAYSYNRAIGTIGRLSL